MGRAGRSLNGRQALVAAGTLALAALLAAGALQIGSEAGYSGIGPNVVPWVVAAVLAACGGWLLWEAASGGFRRIEAPAGVEQRSWGGFAWVSAGILLNAALITTLGFILSCALGFALAVRGFKLSEGRARDGVRSAVFDLLVGVAIAAPVYWMFTKLLAINLPGLTASGWI